MSFLKTMDSPTDEPSSIRPPCEKPWKLPTLLVRVAGLLGEELDAFASAPCLDQTDGIAEKKDELELLRSEVVSSISQSLADFDNDARRYLLEVKRACFNGRSLSALAQKSCWPILVDLTAGAASKIAALEQELAQREARFLEVYGYELQRERRRLAGLTSNLSFLRGIALARPGLVEKALQRAAAPAAEECRWPVALVKWERSLLRFATRAAGKLSANSTLTACALGAIDDTSGAARFRSHATHLREISLVRIDRPVLEQLSVLIAAVPSIRPYWLIAWNDSVDESEPGKLQFLREEGWLFDSETRQFRYSEKARASVRLANPALAVAREALREGPLSYRQLVASLIRLAPGNSSPRDEAAAIDQLIRLGILLPLPPWPTHEPLLERRLTQLISSIPAQEEVARLASAGKTLIDLEKAFAQSPAPARIVAEIAQSVSDLIQAAAPPSEDGQPVGHAGVKLFEDVLLVAEGADPTPIVSISADCAAEILRVAALVSRFASVFNHRHDILLGLAAWWKKNEPGRLSMPFAELLQKFGAAWKDFLAFRRSIQEVSATWNPFDSARATHLQALRSSLMNDCRALLEEESPGSDRLSPEALAILLESVPGLFAPQLGASAFVQPADPFGKSWVFNHLHEGTGRYWSRVTPVLERTFGPAFTDSLSARSLVEVGGEPAELLEVKYPFGHLVRAHSPQTRRVLEMRGFFLDLPPERRVRLQDLRVEADLERDAFRLLDRQGHRLLPLQISTLNEDMLPNLVRILLAFGPGEIRNVFPMGRIEQAGATTHFHRLSCLSSVLRRQAWSVDLAELARRLPSASSPDRNHLAIDRWRRSLGLPRRVYYRESIQHAAPGSRKPQYLDFSSPSLVQLFTESASRAGPVQMLMEEALPTPDRFPRNGQGRPQAIEILVDPLMVGTPPNAP